MDQFREGLRTLDVLQSIEKHPSVWEPLFVHRESSMTNEEFKSVLKPPISMNERQQVVWEHLHRFVDSCSLHGNLHVLVHNYCKYSTVPNCEKRAIIQHAGHKKKINMVSNFKCHDRMFDVAILCKVLFQMH